MVIGICDDLKAAVLELKGIVEEYCRKKEIKADIMVFERGEEAVLNIDRVDILFLDMEMPGMDGIETGREILKRKKDCKIIMETSHEERFKEAFYIKAYRFASKPFSIPEIERCLDDAIGSFIGCEVVELWENRKMCRILQKDILFLKAYDGYVEAYVGGRIMRKDVSLNKMEEILDKRLFFRVSRDCVVNMASIDDYKKGVIHIKNYEIEAARRRKRDFEAAYLEFDITYGG